ncbi:hypothetical protein ABB37_06153 [Leptomonas pyrrhocoris]|uniref:Uncharacterized protein n=1 Tax=Leptomonas pyrrhocoris TaxID=157538 RepID=A0A0M9FYG6_LEPPY|nr:hypothetical protein ABB37_06153 [Leptomonas pyrrhocoris]KPA78553.1 hypothetical protein ABB37_06153 [Leptomonas pyrrhocoris]|eukprot:XP_015656992.1 hypothetical protein ABB37_06153 [Leptomonas pyrrhocoris]
MAEAVPVTAGRTTARRTTNAPTPVVAANTDSGSNPTTAKPHNGPVTAEAAVQSVSSSSSSILQRYLPPASSPSLDKAWNSSDAVVFSTFLAQVQFSFVRCCCQLLAKLTTATSPAFLHAAALGEAALASAASNARDSVDPGDVNALSAVDQLADRQEQAYRTIRATIAASCELGHRSCQVLWGPRGSGKHRLLRLLAQEVRRTPRTFVMELHGRLLRDDEAALGVIAQQLFAFLQSPQSQQLRAAHYLLRTGSFGFGQLFHFERRMQAAAIAATAVMEGEEEDETRDQSAAQRRRGATGAGVRGAGSGKPPKKRSAQRGRQSEVVLSDSDSDSAAEDEEEDDEELGNADMMVTSTTAYLTGGAASALPHLQRALLLLKSQGCSIVVCIRDIDVFGIRCDQLLYVLSGLMHDSEGSNDGGGLSLVLASAAPDIRQLEKRLSSRLTCETRYVPLLPWSLSGLLAATLHVAAQDASFQLRLREQSRERAELLSALRDGATRLRRGRESLPHSGAAAKKAEAKAMKELQDSMAGLEARLHVVEANLRETRAQRRHFLGFLDTDSAVSATSAGAGHLSSTMQTASRKPLSESGAPALGLVKASGWRPTPPSTQPARIATAPASSQQSTTSSGFVAPRSWTVEGLHAQPGLTQEVQCVLCEELLRQLRVAVTAAAALRKPETKEGGGGVGADAATCLVQRVVSLGVEIELESGTSGTMLTALTSALCKTASGEVDLMGVHGRRMLLQWMRARLQHAPIPLMSDYTDEGAVKTSSSACPPGLPMRILIVWRQSAQSLASPSTAAAKVDKASSGSSDALSSSSSPVLKPPFSLSTESVSQGGAADQSPASTTAGVNAPSVLHRRSESLALLPPLSLLPPHLFDLLAEGQLVGMGYGSREMMLVLFYMHLHHTTGVRQRTVADLLEDVSSSLGTRAAAALDREAFRYAIRLLCRWRLLTVGESHAQSVQLCGSDTRLREFLATVLSKHPAWCEAELGLDAREVMRFRNLV